MYSPIINEKFIPILYRLGKEQGKPMTKIVNEILGNSLIRKYYCRNCNSQIEAEVGTKEAYCDYCHSNVYLLTASQ